MSCCRNKITCHCCTAINTGIICISLFCASWRNNFCGIGTRLITTFSAFYTIFIVRRTILHICPFVLTLVYFIVCRIIFKITCPLTTISTRPRCVAARLCLCDGHSKKAARRRGRLCDSKHFSHILLL